MPKLLPTQLSTDDMVKNLLGLDGTDLMYPDGTTLMQRIARMVRTRRLNWPGPNGKMTLKELSQKTGVHISAISNIEHARRMPSLAVIVRIAAALYLDINQLVRPLEHDGKKGG